MTHEATPTGQQITRGSVRGRSTPLWAVLYVTTFASIGTGVFWSGVAFVAKHGYGFSEMRNLVLFAVMGVCYSVGAFSAGWVTERLRARMSMKRVLAVILAAQGVFCLGPVLFAGEAMLWIAAVGVQVFSATTWAIVESYLTAGRHGAAMRSAIGWFNLLWTGSVAASMLLIAPLVEHHAEWIIGGMSGVYVICMIVLPLYSANPAEHDDGVGGASVPPEYRWLLSSARVLLPLSYVLTAAMTPILPYRFAELGLSVRWETPTTATWMLVRVVTLAVMWRVGFWHGRWGTLLLGGAAMALGFAFIVTGPTLLAMLIGFAMFGVGLGVIYYAALYYAMAVGRAQVDAGGTHEGLIGVGYAVGPFAGLLGVVLSRWPVTAAVTAASGAWTVGVVWSIVGLAAWPAVRPYIAARRHRAQTHMNDPTPPG